MNKAKIHYYDIGDYLSREDKLRIIREFGSVENIPWTILEPNEHGDWINHRNEMFKGFILLGDKENKKLNSSDIHTFFMPYYSNGLKTQRDPWCYNSSLAIVKEKTKEQIDFYNEQLDKLNRGEIAAVDYDTNKISWTAEALANIQRKRYYNVVDCEYRESVYRPFYKQYLLYYKPLNERQYQIPKIFPTSQHKNLVICMSSIGDTKDFSCLIEDCIPDLHLIATTQCFPLYWYEEEKSTYTTGGMDDLFKEKSGTSYIQRDGITDWILTTARKQYGYKVTKEDIFYYVYGLLHSPDYRTTFATDLKKSLPRLPLVEKADDFWAFSKAGRALADLHLNYESIETYKKCLVLHAPLTNKGDSVNYRVEKMRFGKIDSKTADKSVIHYNHAITVEGIPAEAYEYVVNGKSAIEWIMERYAITTDKKSGITNDPNDWAREHDDEKYIFNLLLRVINVSVQTVEIVKGLPKLKFE